MTTDRLYYHDSYLTHFEAEVVEHGADGLRVVLDRTAFYPESGGQMADRGSLGNSAVVDVIEEDGRIVHVLGTPLDGPAVGQIDWPRRFEHMQQHTGQHLLSAVLAERFRAQTVSFHMGAEACTIDLDVPSLSRDQLAAAERIANDAVTENRPVTVSFEDAASAEGLRKASGREGTIRIVSIEGFDRSACGGTHVRSTGEIGCILLRGTERIRGNLRLEFLCGARAVRRARADFDALTAVAQVFSAGIDEVPKLAAAQAEKAAEADKARRKMALELAGYRGRQLAFAAEPGPSGRRMHVRQTESLDEELRAEAQAFTTASNSLFLAWSALPAALLLAVSADSGLHAGNLVKAAVSAAGGRGGGSATVAQGSFPDAGALAETVRRLAES